MLQRSTVYTIRTGLFSECVFSLLVVQRAATALAPAETMPDDLPTVVLGQVMLIYGPL